MNTIGECPEQDQELQNEMAEEKLCYLIVSDRGLELWQLPPDEGDGFWTGLTFPDVKSAHEYCFGSWKFKVPPPIPIR
jgi:hypothetical protein